MSLEYEPTANSPILTTPLCVCVCEREREREREKEGQREHPQPPQPAFVPSRATKECLGSEHPEIRGLIRRNAMVLPTVGPIDHFHMGYSSNLLKVCCVGWQISLMGGSSLASSALESISDPFIQVSPPTRRSSKISLPRQNPLYDLMRYYSVGHLTLQNLRHRDLRSPPSGTRKRLEIPFRPIHG